MIRLLEGKEKIKSRPLYEECFLEDTKEYIDYYYNNRVSENEAPASLPINSAKSRQNSFSPPPNTFSLSTMHSFERP